MDLKLRPGTLEDAETCGRICYEAFATIARQHNFHPDFPAPGVARVQMEDPKRAERSRASHRADAAGRFLSPNGPLGTGLRPRTDSGMSGCC